MKLENLLFSFSFSTLHILITLNNKHMKLIYTDPELKQFNFFPCDMGKKLRELITSTTVKEIILGHIKFISCSALPALMGKN